MKKIILLLSFTFSFLIIFSQNIIKGNISDKSNGETLIGATVKIKGTGVGAVTDFNGDFILKTDREYPITLEVSYVGYDSFDYTLESSTDKIKIKLTNSSMKLETVEVVGGVSDKLKESALTIEAMSINDIKETSSTNFYEGLSHMKGVDLTSASLSFIVINTRGFNSTSPVRSLQIIDGIDNASPGLNFALGNFLGASELDLMKVEIVSGASSAFFGPNAFNGVISMHTKNPFLFPGFSASVKLGERGLNEYAVRYAEVFKNKDGKNKFAYKLNLFYMSANDWVANNSNSVTDLDTDENNPGGYDAVNRYGDENLSSTINNATDNAGRWQTPGLGRWHRTGYWEEDIVDYDTKNLKAALAFHYLINEDIELIASSNFGTGTTVYQGDNRFSLKDILFFQNRIEITKRDNFFIRAYATNEDAGKSYDAVLTAFLMQNLAGDDWDWNKRYRDYWSSNITSRVRALDNNIAWQPQVGVFFDLDAIDSVVNMHSDSLVVWHAEAEDHANSEYGAWNMSDYYQPGTARFDSLKNAITSRTSFTQGGSRLLDKSSLYHIHGEKIFKADFAKITIGMNSRLYKPRSEGSLFSDTNGVVLINKEIGLYGGIEKDIINEKLKIKSTLRLDKNQNFDILPSPAASFIYQPNDKHTFRSTFTSAIRNPTLLNQYMYYNVGRAILVGNINGYDSLVTIGSLLDFMHTQNPDTLDYFNLDPIRPEKVKSVEFGYRGSIKDNIYIDATYYYNWYKDFIGYINGADIYVTPLNMPFINNVYRIATNSTSLVSTQGFSIGINYYFDKYFTINSNYSWNRLNKQLDDPIIPAYNTPEHKYNIGFSGKDLGSSNISFNVNYKWIMGFVYEGSPQFTGFVPTYSLVDAQINKKIPKLHLTAKLGASNALNNKVIQVYGGPYVGRMIYFSLTFDWEDK
jgi:outer membrane cobalamin receptor